jgi:hypothetical protein
MPCSSTARRRPERLVAFAFVALLAACAREPAPAATVRAAEVIADPAPVLTATLELRLSATMLEALERGIPLRIAFALRREGGDATLRARPALELRYAPLAQQFLLEDDSGTTRSFARRTQLLAALDRVRLPLPTEWAKVPQDARYSLSVRLDDAALPGPLRLPALVSHDWRISSEVFGWHAPG